MKLFFNYEEEAGLTYRCNFKGTVPEYAIMYLNLTNNAREFKGVFRHIRNTSTNIYITVPKIYRTDVEEFLKSLELIIEHIEPCTIINSYVDHDEDDIELVFSNVETF